VIFREEVAALRRPRGLWKHPPAHVEVDGGARNVSLALQIADGERAGYRSSLVGDPGTDSWYVHVAYFTNRYSD
jgi:hypothetical protein